jgi:hypothetical protein
MPIGNTGFHKEINLPELCLNHSFIYLCCEFYCIAIWYKGKNLILVGSIFQICQLEIPVSIYNFTFQISVWIYLLCLVSLNFFSCFLSQFTSWHSFHSETLRLLKIQFFACCICLLKSFASNVSGYHQLSLQYVRSQLTKLPYEICIPKAGLNGWI